LCPEESLRWLEKEGLFLADVIAACEKYELVILQCKKLQDYRAYHAKTLSFYLRGKIGCRTLCS